MGGMLATKWLFRNSLIIVGAIATLVTTVVISQGDAMIKLGYCLAGDTACIIRANILYILTWTFVIACTALRNVHLEMSH